MEIHEVEPGETELWDHVLRLSEQAQAAQDGMERWYGQTVDELLFEEGISIDAAS